MRIGQKFVYKNHVHEIVDIVEGFFYGEANTLVFHAKDVGEGKKKCVKVKTLQRFIEKFGEI
jgi:hypothetical protein